MVLRRRRSAASAPAPALSALSEAESTWLANQIELAKLLAERYTGDSENLPTLDRLDAVIQGWSAGDATRVDVNARVNAVGISFGQHLATGANLAWVISSDEHGTDLALHGQPGDILLYPANTVAKRIVAGQSRFVLDLYSEMLASIVERRSQG